MLNYLCTSTKFVQVKTQTPHQTNPKFAMHLYYCLPSIRFKSNSASALYDSNILTVNDWWSQVHRSQWNHIRFTDRWLSFKECRWFKQEAEEPFSPFCLRCALSDRQILRGRCSLEERRELFCLLRCFWLYLLSKDRILRWLGSCVLRFIFLLALFSCMWVFWFVHGC